jgi:hypothetical protein
MKARRGGRDPQAVVSADLADLKKRPFVYLGRITGVEHPG